MGSNRVALSVVGALIMAAAIGWLSWWRAEIVEVKVKVGLSWAEVCTNGGCIGGDVDDLDKMSGKASSDLPLRVRATRWLGWAAVVLLLVAGVTGARELTGIFGLVAGGAVLVGAWATFGDTFGAGSELLKMSWGWPALVAGSVIGLAGCAGDARG